MGGPRPHPRPSPHPRPHCGGPPRFNYCYLTKVNLGGGQGGGQGSLGPNSRNSDFINSLYGGVGVNFTFIDDGVIGSVCFLTRGGHGGGVMT